jgi:hypothetical protein
MSHLACCAQHPPAFPFTTNGARVVNIDEHPRSQRFPERGEPSRLTVITTGHEDYRARGGWGIPSQPDIGRTRRPWEPYTRDDGTAFPWEIDTGADT